MLRYASATTRNLRHNFATVITQLVLIIRFAPLGIFGLVTSTINVTGFTTLKSYYMFCLFS